MHSVSSSLMNLWLPWNIWNHSVLSLIKTEIPEQRGWIAMKAGVNIHEDKLSVTAFHTATVTE